VSLYESLGVAEPLLGLIPASLFFAIYLASASMGKGKAAIGMGDVKLLVPVGLALGMRQGLFAAFVAVALGGITGIVLLASGIKNRKDPIPFGPFIVVGTYAAVFIPLSALYGVLSF